MISKFTLVFAFASAILQTQTALSSAQVADTALSTQTIKKQAGKCGDSTSCDTTQAVRPVPESSTQSNSLLWFVSLLALSVGGYAIFKLRIQDKELIRLRCDYLSLNDKIVALQNQSNNIEKQRLLQQSQSIVAPLQKNETKVNVATGQKAESKCSVKKNQHSEPKKSIDNKVVKYGSFLIDDSGDLKVEQRILVDDDSTYYFKFEYTENDDKAIYSLNDRMLSSILFDLQTIQLFTEPFTVEGAPASVKVISPGILKKVGRSWIVTKKLQIKIN